MPIWFKGFITHFDGRDIIITQSGERYEKKEDAWKWIATTLAEWGE